MCCFMMHSSGSLLHSNKKSTQCVIEKAAMEGLLLRRCQWEEQEEGDCSLNQEIRLREQC